MAAEAASAALGARLPAAAERDTVKAMPSAAAAAGQCSAASAPCRIFGSYAERASVLPIPPSALIRALPPCQANQPLGSAADLLVTPARPLFAAESSGFPTVRPFVVSAPRSPGGRRPLVSPATERRIRAGLQPGGPIPGRAALPWCDAGQVGYSIITIEIHHMPIRDNRFQFK